MGNTLDPGGASSGPSDLQGLIFRRFVDLFKICYDDFLFLFVWLLICLLCDCSVVSMAFDFQCILLEELLRLSVRSVKKFLHHSSQEVGFAMSSFCRGLASLCIAAGVLLF